MPGMRKPPPSAVKIPSATMIQPATVMTWPRYCAKNAASPMPMGTSVVHSPRKNTTVLPNSSRVELNA